MSPGGIAIASSTQVLHVFALGPSVPTLPSRRWPTALVPFFFAAALQATVVFVIIAIVPHSIARTLRAPTAVASIDEEEIQHIVFIAREPVPSGGGGGGGGGNRQPGPIRHAEGVGHDSITLRISKPTSSTEPTTITEQPIETKTLPQVLLDAVPLASGSIEQGGLPWGGVSEGTSTGPGSGGGVGTGVGTGIGSGSGPGIGPGSGGGIGGGVYRPGGAVTPPRVMTEVKPKYTNDALLRKIQGTVVLEFVVRQNGLPSDIRIVRSLDPGGLDEQAIIAANQWRFEPGRLSGKPVDVQVTLMLDFRIR